MSAPCVRNQDIKGKTVNNTLYEHVSKHPKFLHSFMWTGLIDDDFFSPTAHFTLTDPPLPRPPPNEFENSDAMDTIRAHPDLFAVTSPIKVDAFESLLSS